MRGKMYILYFIYLQASTFMAAPIMFISAKLLMVHNLDPSDYMDEIEYFLLDIRYELDI